MAYIGQGIKNGTFAKLDTSGNTYNGSNVTFALGTQVGSPVQLLVSHDGVIQNPGTDYTLASNGTQITFTTAPASGAAIFIMEISGAVGGPMNRDINGEELILDVDGDTSITADTDDQIDIKIAGADDFNFTANTFTAASGSTIAGQAVTATTVVGSGAAQFATAGIGAAKDLGVGLHIRTADSGASVDGGGDELVIENSGGAGISILTGNDQLGRVIFGDAQDNGVGMLEYNHDGNVMKLSTSGNTGLQIDGNGIITTPLQSGFVALNSSTNSNVTGDETNYTMVFDSDVVDRNADHAHASGVFTAPVTGLYNFSCALSLGGIASNHTRLILSVETSNRIYYMKLLNINNSLHNSGSLAVGGSITADMDASDTSIFKLRIDGGSKVVDVDDASKASGFLIG